MPGLRPDSDSSRDFGSRKVYPRENWAILKKKRGCSSQKYRTAVVQLYSVGTRGSYYYYWYLPGKYHGPSGSYSAVERELRASRSAEFGTFHMHAIAKGAHASLYLYPVVQHLSTAANRPVGSTGREGPAEMSSFAAIQMLSSCSADC